ncbi:hypothetical protein [Dysgonomonas sp. ZJ709]|uniref:hypothetical protein n=1 Tax=Dysgonomonas sp. ZJ709 TaxID=2709797 RepID=UPI0013EDC2F6|nr:hypothetical protein [Dysgonomonas sp. ZJ709]
MKKCIISYFKDLVIWAKALHFSKICMVFWIDFITIDILMKDYGVTIDAYPDSLVIAYYFLAMLLFIVSSILIGLLIVLFMLFVNTFKVFIFGKKTPLETRFVVDVKNFEGKLVTTISDGLHDDYGEGETLKEIRKRENNPNLKALTWKELDPLFNGYYKSLCKPFEEIAAKDYIRYLGSVPPKRHKQGRFFVGECYTGTLYRFCFRYNDKHYSGIRCIRLSDEQLTSEIREFSKKLEQSKIKNNETKNRI